MDKPRLLFISPVIPNSSKQGASMRAFAFLQALAKQFRIHLLLHGNMLLGPVQPVDNQVQRLCSDISRVPLHARHDRSLFLYLRLRKYLSGIWMRFPLDRPSDWIPLTPTMKAVLAKNVALQNFDVIHVFRMAMLPLASYVAAASPRAQWALDMDDIESKTRHRLCRLYQKHHEYRRARLMANDAALYEKIEAEAVPRLGHVFVCSEKDKCFLQTRYQEATITVVPNTVPMPENPGKPRPGKPFTFLFLGTLNYYPNQEGILWFVNRVLPLLRKMTDRPFRLHVVGGGSLTTLSKQLKDVPEVNLIGRVPRVSPWYAQADSVIAPLRAGGGTRIKILEAFAHRRPVVCTSLGIEGVLARPEHHFLSADDRLTFARQCSRLMSDRNLREKLSRNGLELVRERYHTGIAHQIIRDGYNPIDVSGALSLLNDCEFARCLK
jgi:glycosyltransferase involved in cell wall biosynthesis